MNLNAKFVIQKRSRGHTATEKSGYKGIVYDDEFQARADARELSAMNPVGFYVVEVGVEFPASIRGYYEHGEKRSIPVR